MDTERNDKTVRSYTLMRSVIDFVMAALYLGVGLFLFFPAWFGVDQSFDKTFSYIFGGICVLYGGFRIFRGLRKQY